MRNLDIISQLQMLYHVNHSVMLNRTRNDVSHSKIAHRTVDDQVIGFSTSGSKNDLCRSYM